VDIVYSGSQTFNRLGMKHIAITGGTSGIGLEMTRKLLREEHQVTLLVRNVRKAEALRNDLPNEVNLHIIPCDLANLSNVRNAANELLQTMTRVDVLINNAGGLFDERSLSDDGFEQHFAVNHLGHFFLTNLIIDLLLESQCRIMNVSSEAHRIAKLNFNDLQSSGNYSSITAYGTSKLLNILFTHGLHQKYQAKGLKVYSAHPGVVASNFAQNYAGWVRWGYRILSPFMINSTKGAEHILHPLMHEPAYPSDTYFKNGRMSKPKIPGDIGKLSDQLWEVSLSLVTQQMA